LPDIGDPFDVAAFRSLSVARDRDAFAYFRRAREKLSSSPQLKSGVRDALLAGGWSKTDPRLRRWVEANRPALELYLRGAEQTDGIAHPGGAPYSFVETTNLTLLALLEGARRIEGGDMAGAWSCYRAVLRMANHIRRRGSLIEGILVGESD